MSDILFLAILGLVLLNLQLWGFKHLPGERWQMLAVVPVKKSGEAGANWLGANLTYYGFFIATSQLISFALVLVLLGSVSISILGTVAVSLVVLAFSLPAARLVAMVVEKKNHTFTIGGASFVGIVVAPWAIITMEKLLAPYNCYMPILPMLAALSIGYTLGEGLGRLGCISYGCCYGKPLKECSTFVQFIFSKISFIFYGATKKAVYEGNFSGEKLVPIQAITSLLYTAGALLGSYLFLQGKFISALIFTMALTQIWRVLSEVLRADFRGFGKVSVYQKMGIVSVLYIVGVVSSVEPQAALQPLIIHGFGALWNPAVILGLQLLWFIFFYVFGRSTVTTSTVSFDLVKEHI